MTFSLAAAGVRAILLDIEGTTTPISFVYDVLFPFAREHVREFLEQQLETPELQQPLQLLRNEHTADAHQNPAPPNLDSRSRAEQISSLVNYINWLMDRDRKSTGLKALQGKIWELGYQDGALQAYVYPDVATAFKRWRNLEATIAIFSSGSVLAQKLLFGHTNTGDLTPLIDHYFDTTVGPKNQRESYEAIAHFLGAKPSEILFVSDVTRELDAAQTAGMSTLLCIRPGNHPQADVDRYQIIRNFNEVE